MTTISTIAACCWYITQISDNSNIFARLVRDALPELKTPATSSHLHGIGPPLDSKQDNGILLGVASEILVVSLPRRTDRREQMERLRMALDLKWTYIDAIEPQHEIIQSIMEQVRMIRSSYVQLPMKITRPILDFRWPDADLLPTSDHPLKINDTSLWNFLDLELRTSTWISGSTFPPLTCATEDINITAFSTQTPQQLILSRPRIACWYSHLLAIRHIAKRRPSNPKDQGIGIILEDDVDMEHDIRAHLQDVWQLLPDDWDIVFLGHCWSNESYHTALQPKQPQQPTLRTSQIRSHLHPSNAPKCTHAYALSRTGARRLLLHLLYPPFAYSRALDQALSWLVLSGRLRSYSIVPSLVVQRKIDVSDIMIGTKGSKWQDSLINGVFSSSDRS